MLEVREVEVMFVIYDMWVGPLPKINNC